jgi:Fur family ferric uptake transcriptional regulator
MHRNTPQHRAIRRAIEVAGRPLSPREVHAAARRAVPRLGVATVYRCLRALVEERWAAAVNLPGEPARYERGGKAHHHHFRCRRCERVYEVNGCGLTGRRRGLPAGFRVERHEVVLHGLCARCG